MIDTIEIVIPWPPSVNNYRAIYNNRLITSSAGRRYKSFVTKIAAKSNWQSFGNARLSVELILFPPDRRRWDLDNRVKPVLDVLQEVGIYNNDNQIDELIVKRTDSSNKLSHPARVQVRIHRLELNDAHSD